MRALEAGKSELRRRRQEMEDSYDLYEQCFQLNIRNNVYHGSAVDLEDELRDRYRAQLRALNAWAKDEFDKQVDAPML